MWGPVRLQWPHAHEIGHMVKRERVLPWSRRYGKVTQPKNITEINGW